MKFDLGKTVASMAPAALIASPVLATVDVSVCDTCIFYQ